MQRQLTDREVDALLNTYLDERHYDTLLSGKSGYVLKPDGTPLLIYCAKVLPAGVCKLAFPALKRAARISENRGAATGEPRYQKLRLNGHLSKTWYSAKRMSGVMGYMDRDPRTPHCRQTAYTRDDVAGWRDVQPFIRAVNDVFAKEAPERYEAQMRVVRETTSDFLIPGTAFTTVTVNRNFRTAGHRDDGDLPEGYGVMTVLQAGEYEGGYLVFPKHRVAVDMRSRDVLLADVHEVHGNTEFIGYEGTYDRISCVFYYRTDVRHCLPAYLETDRARHRQRGDPLK